MSLGLPCPNPTCTYTFPHGEIKGAASLTCPSCGTHFQFGAAAAPAPPRPAPPPARPRLRPTPSARPAPPLPEPAPSPPIARRATPPAAPAPAPAPTAPDLGGSSSENIVSTALLRVRLHQQGSRLRSVLVVGALVLIVLALVVGGALMALNSSSGPAPEDDPEVIVLTGQVFNLRKQPEKAFRLVLPREGWVGNDERKRGFKGVVALDRSDDVAWLAVAAQDYGTRKPRDAELLQGGLDHLESLFGENLELAVQPEASELAGEPAQKLQFRGVLNSVAWSGECYMLTKHGFGYWVVVAGTPRVQVAQEALADLQKERGRGFLLATDRRGWSEHPVKTVTFTGDKGTVSLRAPEAVWEPMKASAVDPGGELYLHGRDLRQRKDNLRSATVLVLALPKPAADLKSAMKAAREHLEEGKKAENKEYKLEPAAEKPEPGAEDGVERAVGNRTGRVAELRLSNGPSPYKYIMLAVVQEGERVYVIQCEAHWGHHQPWRGDFLDLLGTFRVR